MTLGSLLVAFICGSIGASIGGLHRKGCLVRIAVGFIGAFLGGWLSRELGIRELFVIKRIPIVWSIIGSALFVAVIRFFSGSSNSEGK